MLGGGCSDLACVYPAVEGHEECRGGEVFDLNADLEDRHSERVGLLVPSERAGLRGGDRQVRVGNSLILVGGDVIVEIDGEKVMSSDDLIRMIRDHRPGERVELKALRKGKFLDIKVTLGERPPRR